MDLGLAGRVYVVTGGSKGLGFATARCLVDDGARVVVSSRSAESVDAAVAALGTASAVGVPADNADPTTPDRLVAAALSACGRLDGALISVGGPPGTDALGASDEQWRSAFESVFLGAVRMARALVPHLDAGAAIGLVLSTSAVFSALVLRTDEHPLLRVMLVRYRLLLVASTLAALFAAAALGFRARPWILNSTWALAAVVSALAAGILIIETVRAPSLRRGPPPPP